MDLLRENFGDRKNSDDLTPRSFFNHPEGFLSPQGNSPNESPINPSKSLTEGGGEDFKEAEVYRGEVVDYLILKLWVEDLPGKKHAEGYLIDQHRHNCRPNTIRSSYTAIVSFLRFIKEFGGRRLEDISKRDLEAFIEHEQDRGLKLSSVRTRIQIIKAFLRFLIIGEVVERDVFPWKMKIKPPELLPRAIDAEDIRKLLCVIDHLRDRAMILLLLRTGMRIGELLETRVSDVNLKERKILIFEGEKNRTGRVVYFSNDALEALKDWFKERDPNKEFLFYSQRGSTISYSAARMIFCKYLAKAGLSQKGYTLHRLRHTFASELLNAGMRLECLQKLLGHTSLEVTRRYARLTDKRREEEYFRAMEIIEKGEADGDD